MNASHGWPGRESRRSRAKAARKLVRCKATPMADTPFQGWYIKANRRKKISDADRACKINQCILWLVANGREVPPGWQDRLEKMAANVGLT